MENFFAALLILLFAHFFTRVICNAYYKERRTYLLKIVQDAKELKNGKEG